MARSRRIGLLASVALASAATTRAGPAVLAAATPAPVKCAIPKACAMFTNTSSGTALEGMAAAGSGLTGISSGGAGLYGISVSGLYFEPGVEGESANNDGSDAGGIFGANVLITNVAPEYGVLAYGTGYGVVGETESPGAPQSASGYGVFGQDNLGNASDRGDYNVGVFGTSTVGTGVLGESNASPTSGGYYGVLPIGVLGVARTAAGTPNANAFAFYGETNSYGLVLLDTVTGAQSYVNTPYDYFQGYGGPGRVEITTSGNESLSGTLTTSKGGPYVRMQGASGTETIEYTDRATVPQIEDVGEAQLLSGRAYVTIDARLADTIDQRSAYHVFVTPEGDCNQLYVTRKSESGFEVRESHGGRSSVAFDYRIVAKPLGEDGQRLAIAPPDRKPNADGLPSGPRNGRVWPRASTPEERLKRRIGTQAYAEAMLRLRARLTGSP